jgi:DNA-binding CsgD family transcriptional regulator
MVDSDLLEQIYSVPLGKHDWASVLDALRRLFSGDGGVLMTFRADEAPWCESLNGYDEGVWNTYAEPYATVDPLVWAIRDGRQPNGEVRADHQLIHPRMMRRTEFYNGFWQPNGIDHAASGLMNEPDGSRVALALTRCRTTGPFTPEQLAQLQDCFRHLAQAFELEREVAARSAEADLDATARRFGLTAAEVEVVRCLAETGSLRAVAHRLGRSYNTARAHLRSVYGKTGAHSQAALLSLVHRRELP